jgi:hypothetical protein
MIEPTISIEEGDWSHVSSRGPENSCTAQDTKSWCLYEAVETAAGEWEEEGSERIEQGRQGGRIENANQSCRLDKVYNCIPT